MALIEVSYVIPATVPQVYDCLTQPQNLARLLSPLLEVEWQSGGEEGLKRGSEILLTMTRYHLSQQVRLRVEDVVPEQTLTYRQTLGLFAYWLHTMKFQPVENNETRVLDRVEYELPMGILGHLASDLWVRRDIERLLRHRLRVAADLFGREAALAPESVST